MMVIVVILSKNVNIQSISLLGICTNTYIPITSLPPGHFRVATFPTSVGGHVTFHALSMSGRHPENPEKSNHKSHYIIKITVHI